MMKAQIRGWATAALVAVGAVDAQAQTGMGMGAFRGYLTGHAGLVTGGEVSGARGALGASVSVHEDNGWGAELDFGHASGASAGNQTVDISTYLVNAMFIQPRGLVRPFGLVGVGVMQLDGCAACNRPSKTYDLGVSLGGGAFIAATDTIGFRGDARYFWSGASHDDLGRPDTFSFWRISAGVTFMWAIAP